jgi:hypothetical protein
VTSTAGRNQFSVLVAEESQYIYQRRRVDEVEGFAPGAASAIQ